MSHPPSNDLLDRAASAPGHRPAPPRSPRAAAVGAVVRGQGAGPPGRGRASEHRGPKGERVALVYPTCAEFFESFFGILTAGAVPVPLYPPVRLGRLDEFIAAHGVDASSVDVRLVLADRRVRRLLGEAIEKAAPPLGCWELGSFPRVTWPRPRSRPMISPWCSIPPEPRSIRNRWL